MPKPQFLNLPWNLDFSSVAGKETAHGVPVHAIDRIDVSSYADAENGRGDNITLHFNDGGLSIESKGNAVEVLKVLDSKKDGGLTENDVIWQQHKYINTSAGGIGQGWVPSGEPQTISVPDFLNRTA